MVVGASSAIISTHNLQVRGPSGSRAELCDATFTRSSSASLLHARSRGAQQQSGAKRGWGGAAAEMLPAVAGFFPSPSYPIDISGVSDSRIFRKASCILRSSQFVDEKNTLQQFEVGKDWRRSSTSLVQSSSSASSVSEEDCETVDPGLLARVSKLYRPAVILPGLGNNSTDYNVLVQSLEALGLTTTVLKVARVDWLRNAAGLLKADYWKGKLRPRPVLDWYLDRLKDAIKTAKTGATDGKVSLIGHSAGGWLARVYMAEFGTEDVGLLLTLGTPHLPPPRGIPGVFDQTRGLLYYVEENCPGAYHAPNVKYVCVAGRYLNGGGRSVEDQSTPVVTTGAGTLNLEAVASKENAIEKDLSNAIATNDNSQAEKIANEVVVTAGQPEAVSKSRITIRERFIGAGYKQVCGRADVWGDGVVPEESAFLEGAINISLDGVYHSPVGANDLERPWYGSAGKIDQWVHHLLVD